MTDLLNRAAGQVDMAAALIGGRTDLPDKPSIARLDFARVEELLIAGQWVPIKRGTLSGSTSSLAWFGGPSQFLAFVRPDGKTGAVRVDAVQGFSPLAEDESQPPASRVVLPPPAPVPDDGSPVLYVTPEERQEANFLANDYERAAARERADSMESFRFSRMAEAQRQIAARPVREADPEPDDTIVLDTASPLASMLDRPKK